MDGAGTPADLSLSGPCRPSVQASPRSLLTRPSGAEDTASLRLGVVAGRLCTHQRWGSTSEQGPWSPPREACGRTAAPQAARLLWPPGSAPAPISQSQRRAEGLGWTLGEAAGAGQGLFSRQPAPLAPLHTMPRTVTRCASPQRQGYSSTAREDPSVTTQAPSVPSSRAQPWPDTKLWNLWGWCPQPGRRPLLNRGSVPSTLLRLA